MSHINENYAPTPTIAGGADALNWFRNPTAWYAKHGNPLVRRESLPCIHGPRDEYDRSGEFDSGGHDEEV